MFTPLSPSTSGGDGFNYNYRGSYSDPLQQDNNYMKLLKFGGNTGSSSGTKTGFTSLTGADYDKLTPSQSLGVNATKGIGGDGGGTSFWGKDGKLNTAVNFANAAVGIGGLYLGFKTLSESKRQAEVNEGIARTNLFNQASVTNEAINAKYEGLNRRAKESGVEGRHTSASEAMSRFGASTRAIDDKYSNITRS